MTNEKEKITSSEMLFLHTIRLNDDKLTEYLKGIIDKVEALADQEKQPIRCCPDCISKVYEIEKLQAEIEAYERNEISHIEVLNGADIKISQLEADHKDATSAMNSMQEYINKLKAEVKDLSEWIDCMIEFNDSIEAEINTREIIRTIIWKIATDEGGHILHYNDWVDDNWKELKKGDVRKDAR